MELISTIENKVTTATFQIAENKNKYTYTEYKNEKGKVIDETLQDEAGVEINDPELLERIRNFPPIANHY